MLEVEGHSSNRWNRNRIRKHLRKKLDGLKSRTDISEDVKRAEMRKLESQLDYYQRPPKPMKQSFDWRQRKCQGKHQLMPRGKGRESAGRVTLRPGRRYGIPGSGVSYPIHRVMSSRRYGVSSEGKNNGHAAIYRPPTAIQPSDYAHRGWTLPTIIALPNENELAKNYTKIRDAPPENDLPQQIIFVVAFTHCYDTQCVNYTLS